MNYALLAVNEAFFLKQGTSSVITHVHVQYAWSQACQKVPASGEIAGYFEVFAD